MLFVKSLRGILEPHKQFKCDHLLPRLVERDQLTNNADTLG